MPFDPATLAMQAGNAVIGTGMGLLTAKWQDKRQVKQQKKLQELQIAGQKELTDYNQMKALEMWKDTSYGAQKEQMKLAGINPALMYGMGGGGGQTANVAQGSVAGGNAPSGGGEIGMGIQQAMQLQLLKAQKDNIEADTENKKAQTGKAGAETQTEGYKQNLMQLEQDLKTDLYEAGVVKGKGEANWAMHNAIVKYWERVEADASGPAKSYYAGEAVREEYMDLVLSNIQTMENTNLTKEQQEAVKQSILTQIKQLKQGDRELDQKDTQLLIEKTRNELIDKGIEWGAASQIAGDLIRAFTPKKK